jgi:molecular chaperone GrpE
MLKTIPRTGIPVKKMTKGKETPSANKDGSTAGTDNKSPLVEKKTMAAAKGTVPENPVVGQTVKVEAKPKTELEAAREAVAALKNQLKKVTDELNEWKDKHLYLQAEFDNAEKRRIKALDGQRKRMQADLIFSFLPLVDSFIPAVKKADEGAYKDVKQLGEGLKSLKQQLDSILKGLNVTPINQINVPFDYNLHEVNLTQERSDVPDDTVLSIIQVGWKLGQDVIRPAKVVVSKKPVPPTTPAAPVETKVVDLAQAQIAQPETGKQPPEKAQDDTKRKQE